MIKLSIVIPFYNSEPYTSELIEALRPQITDEVEVIVVDDGSKEPFVCNKPWVKILRKENGGTGSARNAGLEIAQGQYIHFVDSDDMLPDYYVEKILKKIEQGADVIDFSWRSLDHSGVWVEHRLIEDKTFLPNPSASTRCFKRSFIGDTRFNEQKDSTEDEDFSRRLGYLFDDTDMVKASMADFMYFYRTGVTDSQSKKFKQGLRRTKRVTYFYNHVTADMDWLLDEIKTEDETNEVRLLTYQNDIPELKRYAQIVKPLRTWTHFLRGEKTNLVDIVPIPMKKDVIMYVEFANRVGGITSFLYYWCQYFRKDYNILLLYDRIDEQQLERFKPIVDTMRNDLRQRISCDTLILNRLTDKIPKNVIYNKTVQICHACRQETLRIPTYRDYLVNVSEYAQETWGKEAEHGIVINNMAWKTTEKSLFLVSATRIGASDKGDNDLRFRQLANKLCAAKIDYVWLNFSDRPLNNMPKNFINMEPRPNIQDFIRRADYVVQLSSYEACSMTVQEALINNTPLICCPVPSFTEQGVEDGFNAHVIPFDMDFDARILLDIPEFEYKQDTENIKAKWEALLKSGPVRKPVVMVRCIQPYTDLELNRKIQVGTVLEMKRERAEYLRDYIHTVEIIGG